jgi:hypothetical protein
MVKEIVKKTYKLNKTLTKHRTAYTYKNYLILIILLLLVIRRMKNGNVSTRAMSWAAGKIHVQ